MLKELTSHWEDLYALQPLDKFLQEVKDIFGSDEIKENAIKLLHRYTQLEEYKDKGVIESKDYISMQTEISTAAYNKILKKIMTDYLPILPVKAIAGPDSAPQYAVEYKKIDIWKHVPDVKPKNKIGIKVEGDSMLPLYNSGDILVCEMISLHDITERQNIVVVCKDQSIF